jgi:hypothetical protein
MDLVQRFFGMTATVSGKTPRATRKIVSGQQNTRQEAGYFAAEKRNRWRPCFFVI